VRARGGGGGRGPLSAGARSGLRGSGVASGGGDGNYLCVGWLEGPRQRRSTRLPECTVPVKKNTQIRCVHNITRHVPGLMGLLVTYVGGRSVGDGDLREQQQEGGGGNGRGEHGGGGGGG